MAGCGATYESRYWGRDLKVVCVEKANIERSGAVAQGLYAINCYMGMQWDENQPEDHVRYARNDLMGLVREDLGYDIARHVDSTVHKFEEWGLPIMKDPETGRYQREGKWQIMIHGESYKPIVAEAARKAATEIYNRIMVTHLLMDETKKNRVAGAVGFNVRTGDFYVFRAKAVIVAAGGASHIYKPRSVGEGMGRTWYAPWSSASAYALPIEVGAKMTQMENRIVLTRFKDGYGPVGAYFLHLKTYTENAYGNEYESTWYENTKELVGDYIDRHPVPTCLRNHAMLEEVKAGRGPIRMVTKEAFQDPHLETIGWENFLGMTIGQAVVWASQNIDPKHTNPELTTSEPYVMGSHATCSGAWASGPEDYAPDEYQWGYNRMMTVDGLFDRHAQEILPANGLQVRILKSLFGDHTNGSPAGLDLLEHRVVTQTGGHRMPVDIIPHQFLCVFVPGGFIFITVGVFRVRFQVQEIRADRAIAVLEPGQNDPILHLRHLGAYLNGQSIGRGAAPGCVPGPAHTLTYRAWLVNM